MTSAILGICRVLMPKLYSPSWNKVNHLINSGLRRNLHTIQSIGAVNLTNNAVSKKILLSQGETLQCKQICGLKYLVNVHRRCKDCYLMYIEGVLHNFCTAHPRHKQRMRTKKPKNTWILTGVTTQTKLRPRR